MIRAMWRPIAHLNVHSGDGRNPSPSGEAKGVVVWSRATLQVRRTHEVGPQGASDLGPEVSEKGIGRGCGDSCARPDPSNCEHELTILTGKVARDHVHVFVSYRPHQDISTIVQWLKGISSRVLLQEFAHLRKMFWGRHFWARGYMAVSSGTITDEMVAEYIAEQEGEPVHDDSQFPIDSE